MFGGLKSFLFGYHSFIIHTYYVTKAWKTIYKQYPSCRKLICILFHDIGYILQWEDPIRCKDDNHPELGARICKILFGNEYYYFCAGHSRDYAKKVVIPISSLCYADKYSVLLVDLSYYNIFRVVDNYIDSNEIIIETYNKWWKENGWSID